MQPPDDASHQALVGHRGRRSEIGAAWGRLTRKERSRSKSPLRSPLRQVNAGDDRAWEPPAKQTSSALETADLAKLHKGKQAYLDRLVRKANF